MADWKKVSMWLVLLGGINWGLFGLFGLDLVDLILNAVPFLQDLVYIIIGIAAVHLLLEMKK